MAALNHLHLHVTDLARSQAFYESWFGFRLLTDHGSIRFLRDDAGMDLALAPSAAVERMPAWFHFGFRLPDAGAVRAMKVKMTGAGVEILRSCDKPDLVCFRVGDPDGYAIEVYWERP